MNKYKSIYVAATSQHVGKTTSTLGLTHAFMNKGLNLGFSKPVGQQFVDLQNLRVDKDTLLFSDLIDFEIKADYHSPVILGKGATTAYLDEPGAYNYTDRIIDAKTYLEKNHELIIYEGTGHPGVGSVVGLSNAMVAKKLDAQVVMIVEGGIGSTIDRLHMSTSLFRENNVPIVGVIVNKVMPEKIDKVRHYVGKYLDQKGLPLLGVLPYDKTLAFPLMGTIKKAVHGEVIFNPHKLSNKIEEILPGSLIELKEMNYFKNLLLITSSTYWENAMIKLDSIAQYIGSEVSPLGGIVVTGDNPLEGKFVEYIRQHEIPVIRTHLDTFGSVLKISRIEVKINRNTPWKVQKAIELIRDHVDTSGLLVLK